MNCLRLLLLGVVLATFVPLTRAEPTPTRPDVNVKEIDAALHNEWLGVYSKDKKIGYMNEALEKVMENGRTYYRERHTGVEKLQISGQKIENKHEEIRDFDTQSPFNLVRGEYSEDDGQTKKHVKFAVEGNSWEIVQTTGDRTAKKKQTELDYTLADAISLTVWLKKGPSKGSTLTTRDISVQDGKLTLATAKALGVVEVPQQGGAKKMHEVEIYLHDRKITIRSRFDEEAHLHFASVDGLLELRRESEADAKKIEFSDELFDRFLAKIDRPIGPLSTVMALDFEAKGKEIALLPDGPLQSVIPKGSDTYLVKIGKNQGKKIKATEKEIKEALEETTEYPLHDAKVIELAKKAIGDAKTDEEKVKRLHMFVHDFITPETKESGKQAEVHDILERKRGICRHYARLFTCLARAAQVPSREVAGLLYLGDDSKAFGPHQWNEVVLDGCWIEIDSVFYSAERSAPYIRLGADKEGITNLVKSMGKMSFKVLEIERSQQAAKSDPKRHAGKGRIYDKDEGFSIVPPKGWEKAKPAGPAFLALAENKDAFTPSLNVIAVDDDGTPIDKIATPVQKLLAAKFKEWKFIDDGLLTVDGRKAYRLCSQFVLPGDGQPLKVQTLQYFLIGNNQKIYIITFLVPSDSMEKIRKTLEESVLTAVTD